MKVIKTPTGIVSVDELTKIITEDEYNKLSIKGDRLYLITDNDRKNIISIIKNGIVLNVASNKMKFTPSGALTKNTVQDAIIENDTHIRQLKEDLSNFKNNTSNPHKVTKAQIGLGDVDNTSDVNKPVSQSQQTAIDTAKNYVVTKLNNHINSASHISISERTKWNNYYNSISSINNTIGNTDISKINYTITGAISALNISLQDKISKNSFTTHINNTNIHASIAEKNKWNSKADKNDISIHTKNTNIHITADERTRWNNKADKNTLNTVSSSLNNNDLISVISENIPKLSSLNDFSAKRSYVGSAVITDKNWYNIISVRHRNGQSDGPNYGMQIYSTLTTNGSLIYRQQIAKQWQKERLIFDSQNYTNFTNTLIDFTNLKNSHTSLTKSLSTHTSDKNLHITTAERTVWNSKADSNTVNTIRDSYVLTYKDLQVNALGDMQDIRSYIGSAYSKSSKAWYNIINVRHRNGSGGSYNKYGMQIYSTLTTKGSLMYRQLINGIITDDTILDSRNYKSFCTPTNIGAAPSVHSHKEYFSNQIMRAANTVLSAPNGTNGTALFRKLVAADIPSLPTTKISGLGKAATKNIKTLTTPGPSGWKNAATDQQYVPDMSFIAYWNGAYNSGGNSNLSYCNKGAFGTAATKNIGDFAASNHAHSYLPLSGGNMTGNISFGTKGFIGLSGNDCAGLSKHNNIVFKSWYGISFSTTLQNTSCTSVPAVSINCRSGELYTRSVIYEGGTALSNKYQAKGNYAPSSHATNKVSHITAAERTAWNAKANQSSLTSHAGNTTIHITAAERNKWNNNSLGDGKITFTSGDNTNATSWTEVTKISSGETHTSILSKLTTMIKNIRYLYKLIGKQDISFLGDGTITGNINRVSYRVNRGEGESKIFIGTSVIHVNRGNDFLVLSASRVNRIINEPNASSYIVTMFAYNGDANSQSTPGLWIYKKSGDFRAKTSATVSAGLFRVDWVMLASTKNANDYL